jgi:outer membrane lipoprotein-sorting protein
MSDNEIENQLDKLRQVWPGKSVADQVIDRLPDTPRPARSSRKPTPVLMVMGALAALIMLVAMGFWPSQPRTLQAALQESLQQAQSWHVTKQVFDSDRVTVGEIWFHRDHGLRTEGLGQVTVDDGTKSYTWSTRGDSTVLLRPSMDGIAMVAEMYDLSHVPTDWRKRREPQFDQELAGHLCQAYVLVRGPDAPSNKMKERLVVLVDADERLSRLVEQRLTGGEWKRLSQVTIDYQRQIAASVFEPDYPKDAKVVDVQAALEGRFPLSEATVTREKDGLLFAVHDLIPIDEGCWYVVSSVRGTADYLQKYPAAKRRFNLNYTAQDVASQPGSHGAVGNALQLPLFQMEWQGVDYLWRLVVRRDHAPPNNGAEPGRVRLPLVADHMHPDRRDARGVQQQTSFEVDVPITQQGNSTLEQVIAKARLDMKLVRCVLGETGSMPIAGSIANSLQITSFDEITDEAYARELAKARWQVQAGDYSGADPPEGWDATAMYSVAGDTEGGPEPKFGDEPRPLPPKISGVVQSAGKPVANARVTVLIRRFSKLGDRERDGPGPWSDVTNAQGQYSIAPSGTIRPNHDEVRINVVADGFADAWIDDYEKTLLDGSLPRVEMVAGRRVAGRLVDQGGKPVTEAVLRFQSNSADLMSPWDSGPFPVDHEGRFSISIPIIGKAAAAVYPAGFAPRFIDVTEKADQGNISLAKGVVLKGRVVDRKGNGVARTVVGIRKTEHRELFAFLAVIGMAVRADEAGYFQLPPLRGSYVLSVGKSLPDYSKQMMLTGSPAPPIVPVTVNIDDIDSSELILLRPDL